MGYTYTNLDSIGLSLLWLFDTIHTLWPWIRPRLLRYKCKKE
jgi:hypothetical protein